MMSYACYYGEELYSNPNETDICFIDREEDEFYRGRWVQGFGFYNLKFVKSATRPLTPEEFEKWAGRPMVMNDRPIASLPTDKELYWISNV